MTRQVVMFLLSVVCAFLPWAGPDYHDSPEWKAYQERVVGAFAIEVRWTEREYSQGRMSAKTKPDKTRSYRVRCMKPGYVSYEEAGVRRVVWNGKAGLDLNLKDRAYVRLAALPRIEEIDWLDLPEAPDPQRTLGEYTEVRRTQEKVGASKLPCVSTEIHEIDFARTWARYFDPATRLLRFWDFSAYGLGPYAELLRTVTLFDVEALLIRDDFSATVPDGFTERPPKSG